MISLAYHADLKEVQRDCALADALALAAGAEPGVAGPFDRLGWWLALQEECAVAPILAVARQGDALAALPLAHGDQGLKGLANWYTFRLRALLTPGADSPALLKALAREVKHRGSRLTLSHIPEEQIHLLADAFRAAGWMVQVAPCDINHWLDVAGRSYVDYLAARPGPLRTTLKRKAKKVSCEIHRDFSEDIWADYEAIYAASWKGEEGSMAFLKRFAQEEAAAGRLRLGLARAEGKPVAAQLWTVEAGTAFIHKLAYIEEAKPLSPGTSLSAALFQTVIDEDRVSFVDFGTGDDPYKRDWMEQQRNRWQLQAIDPRAVSQWPALGRMWASTLVARVKRRF
ncbi:GNAT family N-acetyltransferase [Novosphingobium terrae]|uniref:GNAT family N-acetyltransferase n=1 Tax=Novosphingobium terrae TaxID=2726189 RepID=UPI00197D936C|nr:GNAT family N-acetyltransferase [Novosphingobium terrae]